MDWQTNWFAQQATFWRRSLFERAGQLDESLHLLMDWELWLRFYALAEPAIINRTLAGYRYHSDAKCVIASRSGWWRLQEEELHVHRKILRATGDDPLTTYRRESAERVLALAATYLSNSEKLATSQQRTGYRGLLDALLRRARYVYRSSFSNGFTAVRRSRGAGQ
jgi:hypothetical protein